MRLGEFLSGQLCPPFVISREFNAPRELVWKAWTERARLMEWFGPKGCTIPVARMDFRAGGEFHYCMRTPDGNEIWGKWIFREIVAPEKIVLANSFADKDGNLTPPAISGAWSLQMLTETTFTEREGKTTITLKWFPLDATVEEIKTFDAMRGSFSQGWKGTFEQLAEYLKKNLKEGRHEFNPCVGWHKKGRIHPDGGWQAPELGGQRPTLRGLGDISSQRFACRSESHLRVTDKRLVRADYPAFGMTVEKHGTRPAVAPKN